MKPGSTMAVPFMVVEILFVGGRVVRALVAGVYRPLLQVQPPRRSSPPPQRHRRQLMLVPLVEVEVPPAMGPVLVAKFAAETGLTGPSPVSGVSV